MKNQDIVLVRDNDSTYSGEKNVALELNYRNGDQRLNVKVFFAKAWRDIISKFGYVLHPFRRNYKIDLNGACMFYANDAVHLTRIVDRRSPDILRTRHKHFIDVVTGCEYCSNPVHQCKKVIPYDVSYIHGRPNCGIFGSPINYITNEEYIKINNNSTSRNDKLAIIYSMLQRANESYQEQKVKKLNK